MSDDILGTSEDIRNQRTNKQCASQNRVYGHAEDTQAKKKKKKAKKHAGRHACTQTYTTHRNVGTGRKTCTQTLHTWTDTLKPEGRQ